MFTSGSAHDVLIVLLVCCCLMRCQAFPVLMGEIEPSGNLNANIIHQFTKNLRCKFISQVRNSLIFLHVTVEATLMHLVIEENFQVAYFSEI